ncbi:MAG: ATPase domain protein [Planctomycetaceae bacterium]|nr:ATPase domain protein [Planctomycetaceae bacterium]
MPPVTSRAANQMDMPMSPTESDRAWERLKGLLPTTELTDDNSSADYERWAEDPIQAVITQEMARCLHRTKPGHVLLVGSPGVGKTSLLGQFAQQIRQGQFHFLKGVRVLSVDVSNVDPEDSRACLELIFIAVKEWGRLILCLEGIVSLMRRDHGRTNKPLLRALLRQSQLKVIGTLTGWEYAEHVGHDAQTLSLFSRLNVPEPEGAGLQRIVQYAVRQLANEFELAIPSEVVERTIALTSVFLLGECQPAKSIDVLRLVCEDLCFMRDGQALPVRSNPEMSFHPREQKVVTLDAVVDVLAHKTGVPRETINGQGRECDFEAALADVVVGQPTAVCEVATELELISAGLIEPNKPASVMMFAGMTGVGKTELAKRVAELYSSSRRLQVYSMGNFTEPHSVSGIIGVPAGYVGHDEGGRLINELRADPYAVFLLDEAEKCHPNVWKPFLNLFDEGWICDQRGVKAYADRAIFILTTNAGDRNISHLTRSGKSQEEITHQVKQALSRIRHERSSQPVFPPQFLSRIKRVIVFNPLDQQAMTGIAECAARRLCRRWQTNREKLLVLSPGLVEKVAKVACEKNELSNGQEGGRIVQKLFSDYVESAIYKTFLEQREAYEQCRQIEVALANPGVSERPIQVEVRFK